MVAFVIALIVGLGVAAAYVALATDSFRDVRRKTIAAAASGEPLTDPHDDSVYAEQGGDFAWKASLGVIASIVLLVLIGVDPVFWYVLPFLSIGTAMAVVVAFVVDRD